jgi:hypothetical protein
MRYAHREFATEMKAGQARGLPFVVYYFVDLMVGPTPAAN